MTIDLVRRRTLAALAGALAAPAFAADEPLATRPIPHR